MTVRYGLDERLATRTHWAFPEYMRVELEHYLEECDAIRAGVGSPVEHPEETRTRRGTT